MERDDYCAMAETLLLTICDSIGARPVGSRENRDATELFSAWLEECGFKVSHQVFDCFDWTDHGTMLEAGGEVFEIFTGPWSAGVDFQGGLKVASSLEELEGIDASDSVLLIRDGLAAEQLIPKNFPFYNPVEQRRTIALLEGSGAAAILAATGCKMEVNGAYPFPVIEDGDFPIPNAYMTDSEGQRLVEMFDGGVSLRIDSSSVPTRACNVVGRKGDGVRILLMAHIDSRSEGSGAIDNAAGVVALMLVAEMLQDSDLGLAVEIVAVNGEDHYANPGEVQLLQENEGRLGDIILGINIDGAGYRHGDTAFSLYGVDDAQSIIAREEMAAHGIIEGDQWRQGDHSLLVQNGVPALALTSADLIEIMSIAHSPDDVSDVVDPCRLVDVAGAVVALIGRLSGKAQSINPS